MDDEELNRLLREWKAPDAPPHLRPPRARSSWQNVVARLVDYRQDSRAGTGARRARAGGGRNRVDLGDLPTAGTGTGARDVRPLAIWRAEDIRRAGAIQAHGSARGIRRGARRAELPARASRPRSIVIRASSSATSSTGRCEPPSTTRRTRSWRRAARSSNLSVLMHTAFGSASKEAPARAVAFMVVPHRQSGVSTQR